LQTAAAGDDEKGAQGGSRTGRMNIAHRIRNVQF
jgi:hypothetical protein